MALGKFVLTEQRMGINNPGTVLGALSSSHQAFYPLMVLLFISGLVLALFGFNDLRNDRPGPSPKSTTALLGFFLAWGLVMLVSYRLGAG